MPQPRWAELAPRGVGCARPASFARAPAAAVPEGLGLELAVDEVLDVGFQIGQSLVRLFLGQAAIGDGAMRTVGIWQGSCAELVAGLVPKGVETVSAFQNVSAHRLQHLEDPVECDVLVSGPKQARQTVMELCGELGLQVLEKLFPEIDELGVVERKAEATDDDAVPYVNLSTGTELFAAAFGQFLDPPCPRRLLPLRAVHGDDPALDEEFSQVAIATLIWTSLDRQALAMCRGGQRAYIRPLIGDSLIAGPRWDPHLSASAL